MKNEKRRCILNPAIEEKIGRALVEGNFLKQDQLKAAKVKAQATGKWFTEVLLVDEVVIPDTLAAVISFKLDIPVVDLRQFRIQPEAIALVPEEKAREWQVLPLSLEGDVLRVAMEDPWDVQLVDTLAALTSKRIRPVFSIHGGIQTAIDFYYFHYQIATYIQRDEAIFQESVVRAVDMILEQAVRDGASEIHIKPEEDMTEVSYLIRGKIEIAVNLPIGVHPALVAGIRAMVKNGKLVTKVDGKEISFRVVTREMVIMRIEK